VDGQKGKRGTRKDAVTSGETVSSVRPGFKVPHVAEGRKALKAAGKGGTTEEAIKARDRPENLTHDCTSWGSKNDQALQAYCGLGDAKLRRKGRTKE